MFTDVCIFPRILSKRNKKKTTLKALLFQMLINGIFLKDISTCQMNAFVLNSLNAKHLKCKQRYITGD